LLPKHRTYCGIGTLDTKPSGLLFECSKAEASGKDYEAVISRAVLIKPLASMLKSYPNIYEVGVTCVEVQLIPSVPSLLNPRTAQNVLHAGSYRHHREACCTHRTAVTIGQSPAQMDNPIAPSTCKLDFVLCCVARVHRSRPFPGFAQVKSDYSDLEAVVKELLGDPDRMQRIADTAYQRLLSHSSVRTCRLVCKSSLV